MSARNVSLLMIGVVAVSFSAIFIRIADAPSITMALYRNLFSLPMVLPLVALRRRDEVARLSPRQIALIVLAGAFLALHFAVWIASLSYTTIAASVVLVTAQPIIVALGGRLLFGDRIPRVTYAGILIGLVGAAIVSGGDLGIETRYAFGDFLAILGALFAAGYFLSGRKLRSEISLLTYVGLVYSVTTLLLLPMALASGATLSGFDGTTWLMFALMAAVPQMLGHTVFNYLLKDVDTTLITVAIMGEPVGSTLLGLAFFREVPPWTAVLGGAILLIGIYFATTAQARVRRAEPETLAVPVE